MQPPSRPGPLHMRSKAQKMSVGRVGRRPHLLFSDVHRTPDGAAVTPIWPGQTKSRATIPRESSGAAGAAVGRPVSSPVCRVPEGKVSRTFVAQFLGRSKSISKGKALNLRQQNQR